MDTSTLQIAHLMRRAGFSCSVEELNQRVQRGLDATITDLIHYENSPDVSNLFDPSKRTPSTLAHSDLYAFWLHRMIASPRQLQEKMTLFWHGHFATGLFKVDNTVYMLRQNELFRANALSDFRTLLLGVSCDPAMLVWLDNVTNSKKAPNENYAREIMELFTMGRGNYTEDDVKAGARAFTGWQIKNDRFWVNVQVHDFSPKTYLGVTGRLNGDEIVEILANEPATAKYMATKLLQFFATDQPDGAWIYKIAEVFSQSNGDMRQTVEAIFRSDEFYSDSVVGRMYKSPADYAVGAIRELGILPTLQDVGTYMVQMGQDLFDPPSVKGWDAGPSWINTATVLARINFADYLAANRSRNLAPSQMLQMMTDAGVRTADDAVTFFQNRLGGVTLSPESRSPLVQYLDTPTSGLHGSFALTAKSIDIKVRNMIRLMLSAPEYQLS